MHPNPLSVTPVLRRRALGRLGLVTALVLAGCASTPPAKFTPEQVRALRDLGFFETDEGWQLNLGGKVLFAFDNDRLGPNEVEAVARIAATLQKVQLSRLRIEGHTDNVGGADYNQRLSLRRAEVVMREFEARGLPAAGMQARGFGLTRPIADNATEAGRAQNRRVAIIVLGD